MVFKEVSDTPVKLSICIATFNRACFIAETLDSLIEQLDDGIEIVIVDGASTDNTEEIVRGYKKQQKSIRYFREAVNSGVDADYDKAVRYASGEYCWLFTDDDILVDGAIDRVMPVLSDGYDLCLVNSEVYSSDFTEILQSSRLRFSENRRYDENNRFDLLADAGDLLSFIGSVIIRRSAWLIRERKSYYGSLFIHVGVIFQKPIIKNAYILSMPLIKIRYGNAMWTSRKFEIWMFKWPKLIWSFKAYSANSKKAVCSEKPWLEIIQLSKFRAKDGYGEIEYQKYIRERARGLNKLSAWMLIMLPVGFWNFMAVLFVVIIMRSSRLGLCDLLSCRKCWKITKLLPMVFFLKRNIV